MGTALDFISLRAPAFALRSDINELITAAEAETSDNYPAALHGKAAGLLVCHWITLEARDSTGDGVAGAIVRKKEGKLEIEYSGKYKSDEAIVDADLEQTRWGLELMGLKKTSFPTFFNRMM